MEPILSKLAEQSPPAVAIIVVVYIFVRFLQADYQNRRAEREATQLLIQNLHLDHLKARQETREELSRNTEALKDHAVITQRSIDLLAALADGIKQWQARA